MRIGGLASGMDIDTLVGDLMKAERMGMDKLKQKKQTLEWQRDDYRAMNTLLLNFRSELTQMKLSSKYRVRTTTSTDESKIITTATSAASQSSYTISKVDRLATAATRISGSTGSGGTSISAAGKKIDVSKDLYSGTLDGDFANGALLTWGEGSVETKSISVTANNTDFTLSLAVGVSIPPTELQNLNVKVNGTSYQVVSTMPGGGLSANQVLVGSDGSLKFGQSITKDSTIKVDYVASNKIENLIMSEAKNEFSLSKESIKSINTIKIGTDTYTVDEATWKVKNGANEDVGSVDPKTGFIKMSNTIAKDTAIEVDYKQNYTTFSIQSETSKGPVLENFLVQGSDSINSLMARVNGSVAGVNLFFDDFKQQMTLTRSETGDYKAGTGNEMATSGRLIQDVFKFAGVTETGGVNAKFTINGLDTERSSNTFEMNGITFTLKQAFDGSTGSVTVAVNNDGNKVFENIKGFVDKYNELIGKIQGEVSETYYKSYKPLTDEQRESLSDKQQEQWEEKARSGMLRRDSILTSNLSKMRSDFYAPVTGDSINSLMNQLTAVGIKTSANYLEGGKLEIDEAKLKKAIETNPEDVEKLFTSSGSTDSQKGIIHRLYDTVSNTMNKLKERAGNSFSTNAQFTLGKQLNLVDSQINRFEDKLVRLEDRYWRQFTAMEKAIQQSNQQSMYLMQQFSS
ncbi:flagellar filament capping protein FliD [Peribacillus acanthi]|uniref:flagellar filament capping protein FliD n=1 Tax=Peribacillus acanthi TaxID=2171554 RepID=UPI001300AE92|nr:flagellar filament capping protein FliD [Peribacillus acanthi]